MQFHVEKDSCIGCGLCINICPSAFKINDEGKSEETCAFDSLDLSDQEGVLQSKDMCPVSAIIVSEEVMYNGEPGGPVKRTID